MTLSTSSPGMSTILIATVVSPAGAGSSYSPLTHLGHFVIDELPGVASEVQRLYAARHVLDPSWTLWRPPDEPFVENACVFNDVMGSAAEM